MLILDFNALFSFSTWCPLNPKVDNLSMLITQWHLAMGLVRDFESLHRSSQRRKPQFATSRHSQHPSVSPNSGIQSVSEFTQEVTKHKDPSLTAARLWANGVLAKRCTHNNGAVLFVRWASRIMELGLRARNHPVSPWIWKSGTIMLFSGHTNRDT